MPNYRFPNWNWLERTPTSPAALNHCLTEVLYNSTTCRCKVESVNPTTGEYRIALQGTLDCCDNTTTTTMPN
jgi:hypothetical protein